MTYKTLKIIEKIIMNELSQVSKEADEIEEEVEKEISHEASLFYPDLSANRKLQDLTKKHDPLMEKKKELEAVIDELQNLEMR